MDLEWDAGKYRANLTKHGVDFQDAQRFDWGTALVVEDARRDYGEARMKAIGLIDGRLHLLVFTTRNSRIRIISLRKANKRERESYGDT